MVGVNGSSRGSVGGDGAESSRGWPLALRIAVLPAAFLGLQHLAGGQRVAPVALAFGMLQATWSATDLGIVLTAREAVQRVLLLFGGVVSDRVSRHRVLAWSNSVSGAAQVVTGALFLTHHAVVWDIAILAALNGAATAFLFPAFNGAVPSTVPAASLR
ncbi:MAG: MFS transporter [Candidatus Dormibacteria bacterium]